MDRREQPLQELVSSTKNVPQTSFWVSLVSFWLDLLMAQKTIRIHPHPDKLPRWTILSHKRQSSCSSGNSSVSLLLCWITGRCHLTSQEGLFLLVYGSHPEMWLHKPLTVLVFHAFPSMCPRQFPGVPTPFPMCSHLITMQSVKKICKSLHAWPESHCYLPSLCVCMTERVRVLIH